MKINRPCPMNPPLPAATRERLLAACVGFYKPRTGETIPYEKRKGEAERRMARMDMLPEAVRLKIHALGSGSHGLAYDDLKVCKRYLKRAWAKRLAINPGLC